MKPTKLCRMVKIMLQFAIKLFSDHADAKIINWFGSFYITFENFWGSKRKDFINLVFAAVLNR